MARMDRWGWWAGRQGKVQVQVAVVHGENMAKGQAKW